MTQPMRRNIALLIKGILLTWPVVHLILTLCCGINSWKLSGWGMYATAHHTSIGLKIFLLAPDGGKIESWGPVLGQPSVVEVTAGGTVPFELGSLPDAAQSRLRGMMNTVRVLRWEGLIARLVETLQSEMGRDGGPSRALVLFSTPRSSLQRQQTYTVNQFFLYHPTEGQAVDLGVYSSADSSEEEMLRLIGEELRP